MPRQKEGLLKDDVLKWAKENGLYARKKHGGRYSRRGDPDIDMIVCGFSLKVELKKDERSKTSPLQDYELQCARDAGGVAIVAWTIEQIASAVAALQAKAALLDSLVSSSCGAETTRPKPEEPQIIPPA